MENFTKVIKKRISQFLNSATAAVVHSYERYLSSDFPDDIEDESKKPEEFKKFHDAGKSAASHLESLLKLAKATDEPADRSKEAAEDEERQVQEALQEARAELDEKE